MAQITAELRAQPDSEIARLVNSRVPEGMHTATQIYRRLRGICFGLDLHPTTLYRWMTRGVRGVVWESWFVGSTRVTNREALIRFLTELNQAQKPGAADGALRSPAVRRRDYEKAERALDALGV